MNFLNLDEKSETTNYSTDNTLFIYDNLLSNNDFNTMKSVLSENMKHLKAGHSSVGYHPYTHTHYSMDLTHIPFFNTFMMQCIEEKTQKKFDILRIYSSLQKPSEYGNYHIDDIEANTYTFTTYCTFSTNSATEQKTNYSDYNFNGSICVNTKHYPFTIENYTDIYKSDENDILKRVCEKFNEYNINGGFDILLPNTKNKIIIRSVPFVPNRGLFFPSCLVHNGNSFNNNINAVRCVVSFKLKGK